MLNNVFNDMSLIFQEAYMKYMEENPEAGLNTLPVNDEEDAIDYDADGNPIIPERSKIIDPLPPVDHSMVLPHRDIGWYSRKFTNFSQWLTLEF